MNIPGFFCIVCWLASPSILNEKTSVQTVNKGPALTPVLLQSEKTKASYLHFFSVFGPL